MSYASVISGLSYCDLGDGLYLGSCPRTPEHIRHLAEALSVRHVVNLQTDEDLKGLGLRWELLWRALVMNGLEVRRAPIIDFNDGELERGISKALQELDAAMTKEGGVYLHCTAGLNRSPSIALVHLAVRRKMGLIAALEYLYERHRCQPIVGVVQSWIEANYPEFADA